MSSTRPASPKGPATEPPLAEAGVLLCGHGAGGRAETAEAQAARLAARGDFAEVRACCLKGRPSLTEALAAMTARRVYLVPLLMAEGYTAREGLARALAEVPETNERLVVCRPVGTHPELSALINEAAVRTCEREGWPPADCTLLVVAHGTRRDPRSADTARRHAGKLAARHEFAEVVAAFLEQSPTVPEALAGRGERPCVAVGIFIERGQHGERDVPRLLTAAPGPAVYAGPVGEEPGIMDLVCDLVRASARTP